MQPCPHNANNMLLKKPSSSRSSGSFHKEYQIVHTVQAEIHKAISNILHRNVHISLSMSSTHIETIHMYKGQNHFSLSDTPSTTNSITCPYTNQVFMDSSMVHASIWTLKLYNHFAVQATLPLFCTLCALHIISSTLW